jgi:AcrR family transcriptional regulator
MNVKERTKLNLKDAFWKHYREKPLNKISIKEITDTAGYNRGTFYNYYKDVYDMFEEIKHSLMPSEQLIASVLIRVKNNEWDKIINMEFSGDIDEDYREKTLLLFGPNGDPDFIHEYKRDIREKIAKQVDELGPKEKIKLEYILEFMLSGLLSVTMLWVENDENLPEKELEQLFSEIVENGLNRVFTDVLSDNNKPL